jgi:hypothetical protein
LSLLPKSENGDKNGEEEEEEGVVVVVHVMMAPCLALVTISGSTQWREEGEE